MATDKPNRSRTGCAVEGDVFERATTASVVGRDMNSDCKLFRGDCLDVLKDVKSGSVDMVLADLPYGTTACKWDNIIPFEPLWEQLHRVTKPNAAMCMFGSEPFSSRMRMSNIKRFKYDWVWEKQYGTTTFTCKQQPMKSHEVISVFSVYAASFVKNGKTCTYYPQLGKGKPYRSVTAPGSQILSYNSDNRVGHITENKGTRFPKTVLRFNTEKGLHPTQKPVALLEYLIKTYTQPGDTVLDPTMGSGSTGVACKNLNRNFIGIEMDADYFAIAKRRIDDCNLQAEFK